MRDVLVVVVGTDVFETQARRLIDELTFLTAYKLETPRLAAKVVFGLNEGHARAAATQRTVDRLEHVRRGGLQLGVH